MRNVINKLNFFIIEKKLKKIYSQKFYEFGATPKSLLWKNAFTQDLRLELIIKLILKFDNLETNKICDIGCGYGRLLEKIQNHNVLKKIHYNGIDINKDFINYCKKKFIYKNVLFQIASSPHQIVDFTVMSGTYNLCTFDDLDVWEDYITKCLLLNWSKTKRAMIFNLLVRKQKGIFGGLYYSNEKWIKDICEKNFGKTIISKSSLLPDDVMIFVKR